MVVFDKQKYACLSCIRGHRSSSCEHRDRILLQVRKPGRKSLSEPRSRFALVRKEQGPNAGANCHGKSAKADFKLVRVPSVVRAEAGLPKAPPKQEKGRPNIDRDDDDVVLTEKFVFVHVGDNLYRRELRPDSLSARPQSEANAPTGNPHPPYADDHHHHHPSHHCMPSGQLPGSSTEGHIMDHTLDPDIESHIFDSHSAANGSHPNSARLHSPHLNGAHMNSPHIDAHAHARLDTHMEIPPNSPASHMPLMHQVRVDPARGDPTAPLVIAPMSVHNARHTNDDILHELGLTTEEAEQLWPGALGSGTDLSYASQCVMPGQCECGEDCACPDCFEHKLKFETLRS